MKRTILLSTLIIIISSCVSTRSITDYSSNKFYESTLIVIPYESGVTKRFVNKLKIKLEEQFETSKTRIEFILFEKSSDNLVLNQEKLLNDRISIALSRDKKDLILYLYPTKLYYTNGQLQTIYYNATGIDSNNKNEVWKAEFKIYGMFGPSMFASKCAQMIVEKLKLDKIIE